MVYNVNTSTNDGFTFNVRPKKDATMLMEIISAKNPKFFGRSAETILRECGSDLLKDWGEIMLPVFGEIDEEVTMLLN